MMVVMMIMKVMMMMISAPSDASYFGFMWCTYLHWLTLIVTETLSIFNMLRFSLSLWSPLNSNCLSCLNTSLLLSSSSSSSVASSPSSSLLSSVTSPSSSLLSSVTSPSSSSLSPVSYSSSLLSFYVVMMLLIVAAVVPRIHNHSWPCALPPTLVAIQISHGDDDSDNDDVYDGNAWNCSSSWT